MEIYSITPFRFVSGFFVSWFSYKHLVRTRVGVKIYIHGHQIEWKCHSWNHKPNTLSRTCTSYTRERVNWVHDGQYCRKHNRYTTEYLPNNILSINTILIYLSMKVRGVARSSNLLSSNNHHSSQNKHSYFYFNTPTAWLPTMLKQLLHLLVKHFWLYCIFTEK